MLVVAGCGGTIPPPLPATYLRAVGLNRQAEAAFKRGEYRIALRFYREALEVDRSIEQSDGIAINLMNMAIASRELGERENAHRYLSEILDTKETLFTELHRAGAAFVKAKLHLDEGQYREASTWSDAALDLCKRIGCHQEAGINNLKGRIGLVQGDYAAAEGYVRRGLALSQERHDPQEIANAMRLLAELKTGKGEFEEAVRHYEDALAMDKALGVSRKVAMDLMGIGMVRCKQGRREEARRYFRRAMAASEGAGDKVGIERATLTMEQCGASP